MPRHAPFGDATPFAEPAWVRQAPTQHTLPLPGSHPRVLPSLSPHAPPRTAPAPQSRGEATPYYSASHAAWRARVRAFVDTHILPHCDRWDSEGYPKELHTRAYAEGIGGAIFPAALGGTPPEGCGMRKRVAADTRAFADCVVCLAAQL
jgi:hypothetical protein